MDNTIRVLSVDGHPLMQLGLRTALHGVPDIILVGEAMHGHEAQHLSCKLAPHVVLLELTISDIPPVELVLRLHQSCPQTKVLVLSAYVDRMPVRDLMAAGIAGYILKHEPADTVIRSIRIVAQGSSAFSHCILEKLTQWQAESSISWSDLTERERTILHLLATCHTSQQIADHLGVALQTARNYCHDLYLKLGIEGTRRRERAIAWFFTQKERSE